jgi:hypothetical protein
MKDQLVSLLKDKGLALKPYSISGTVPWLALATVMERSHLPVELPAGMMVTLISWVPMEEVIEKGFVIEHDSGELPTNLVVRVKE